jgi:methyl halide transferase
MLLNDQYWTNRYINGETGWDIGHAAPAITHYTQQLSNKSIRILIPGCGNAYEAQALLGQGFTNITLLDISQLLVENLQEKFKAAVGRLHIVHGDFFEHTHQYDLIIEQTFFCAINPSLRSSYVKQAAQLLYPGGKIAGVLFNRDFPGGPPFGGSRQGYLQLFSPYFNILKMEDCYNSIKPRAGTELFILLEKKL